MNKKHFIIGLTFGATLAIAGAAVAVTSSNQLPQSEFTHGTKAPIESHGSSNEIAQVKKATIDLLVRDAGVGNLTPSEQRKIGLGLDEAGAENLRRELGKVWVPSKADSYFDSIIAMYKEDDGKNLDLKHEKVTFEVEKWEGAQVTFDSAQVLVTGHFIHKIKGVETTDDSYQWLISLSRDAQNSPWLMADRQGVRIEN